MGLTVECAGSRVGVERIVCFPTKCGSRDSSADPWPAMSVTVFATAVLSNATQLMSNREESHHLRWLRGRVRTSWISTCSGRRNRRADSGSVFQQLGRKHREFHEVHRKDEV